MFRLDQMMCRNQFIMSPSGMERNSHRHSGHAQTNRIVDRIIQLSQNNRKEHINIHSLQQHVYVYPLHITTHSHFW